jgi:hypothetical protein
MGGGKSSIHMVLLYDLLTYYQCSGHLVVWHREHDGVDLAQSHKVLDECVELPDRCHLREAARLAGGRRLGLDLARGGEMVRAAKEQIGTARWFERWFPHIDHERIEPHDHLGRLGTRRVDEESAVSRTRRRVQEAVR